MQMAWSRGIGTPGTGSTAGASRLRDGASEDYSQAVTNRGLTCCDRAAWRGAIHSFQLVIPDEFVALWKLPPGWGTSVCARTAQRPRVRLGVRALVEPRA